MNKYVYDRIVNVRLYKLRTPSDTETNDTETNDIEGGNYTTNDEDKLYNPTKVNADPSKVKTEDIPFDKTEYNTDCISIECENMKIKPKINVEFKALEGGVTYDMKITITNYQHVTDLIDYVYMEADLGYQVADVLGTGEKPELITLKGLILTCYQSSPNPDGETVFHGLACGEYTRQIIDHPIYVDVYPYKQSPIIGYEYTQNSEGLITSITPSYDVAETTLSSVYFVPIRILVEMVAYCVKTGIFTFDRNEEYADPPGFDVDSNDPKQPLEIILNVPDVIKDFEVDVKDLASFPLNNMFELLNSVSNLITNAVKSALGEDDKYGTELRLVLWNDKLVLCATGIGAAHPGINRTVIRYVYSMRYEGPILHLAAPYLPAVYPGSFVQVYPSFYDGSALIKQMGDVTQLANVIEYDQITEEEATKPTENYIYSVLNMSVSFGTYDNNTMDLVCIPIKKSYNDALEGIRNAPGIMDFGSYLFLEGLKYGSNFGWSHLIYGTKPSQGKVANDLASFVYDNIDAYKTNDNPPDELLHILNQEAKIRLGWATGEYTTVFWNTRAFLNEHDTRDSFYYVGNFYVATTDKNTFESDQFSDTDTVHYFKVEEKTTSSEHSVVTYVCFELKSYIKNQEEGVAIPLCEFWPMIVALSNTVWENHKNDTDWNRKYTLGYDRTSYDPDVVILEPTHYIAMPWAFSINSDTNSKNDNGTDKNATCLAIAEQESQYKELYLISAIYAMDVILRIGQSTYHYEDVIHLLNIYIFLGGTWNDAAKEIEEYAKNKVEETNAQ